MADVFFIRHSTFISIFTTPPVCGLIPLPILGSLHTAVYQEKWIGSSPNI